MTVATTEPTPSTIGAVDPRDQQVMAYLGLDPRKPADRAAVAVCRHYDFDPLLKHVIVIPKGGVYVTRDGLLHVAHRSGQLDGIVVEQEPTLVDGEWVARVSVYRKDMGHPFTFPGRYPEKGQNREYAPEMALKAAEAHALRRAFSITGLPTVDERRPEHHEASGSGPRGLAAALGEQDAPSPADEDVVDGEVIDGAPESPLLDLRSGLAKRMFALLGQAGIPEDQHHDYLSTMLKRPIGSRKDLTEADARFVVEGTEQVLAEGEA